jgi:hypothetical protein
LEVSETDNREVQKARPESGYKPPGEGTPEEVYEAYREQLGWTSRTPDPAQARQLFEAMSRVSPARARQVEEVKAFLKEKYPATFATVAPSLGRVLLARTRPRSRESRPQGRRTRSPATSRGRPRLADDPDESDEHLALLAGRAT